MNVQEAIEWMLCCLTGAPVNVNDRGERIDVVDHNITLSQLHFKVAIWSQNDKKKCDFLRTSKNRYQCLS